jgi:hypothetical protein
MGVTSAGRGHGSTFFFELPVYGSDYCPALFTVQSQPQQPQHHSSQVEAQPQLLSSSLARIDDENVDPRFANTAQPDFNGPTSISVTESLSLVHATEQVQLCVAENNEPSSHARSSPLCVLIVVKSNEPPIC